MVDTWITDMRHFLDEDDDLADLTGPGLSLATHLAAIVAWMTVRDVESPEQTNVWCRRSPSRRRCMGEIMGWFEADRSVIGWTCPLCGDNGIIRGWEDTLWDRRRVEVPPRPGRFTGQRPVQPVGS